MADYFKLEKHGTVALLTYDRPEKRNPINEISIRELEANLVRIRDDEAFRALLITGSGPAFCAGADISHLKGVTDQAERQKRFAAVPDNRRRLLRRTFDMLADYPLPTVAAINGFAVGGGWFLALACDLRIAVENAEFWMPEVDLGSPGPRNPEQRLAAEAGPARAREIIFTCRHFKAPELYQWGLVNRVVRKEELMPVATELAQALAAKKPGVILQAKANINGFTGE
jgi:enoyl-CoA hydratase/carnithine racemase